MSQNAKTDMEKEETVMGLDVNVQLVACELCERALPRLLGDAHLRLQLSSTALLLLVGLTSLLVHVFPHKLQLAPSKQIITSLRMDLFRLFGNYM